MDFEELLDKYEKPIYNLILRLIGDVEEAADLTQDVFVAAYRSRESFRRESAEYTWLYRIAVNRCKNRFKQMARKRVRETSSLDEENRNFDNAEPLASAKVDGSPWDNLHRRELRSRIEKAISELSYDYRVVVILRDLQGLTYQEIAEAADLSIDVVRTRLARGRAMLRQKLGPYIVE